MTYPDLITIEMSDGTCKGDFPEVFLRVKYLPLAYLTEESPIDDLISIFNISRVEVDLASPRFYRAHLFRTPVFRTRS